MTALDNSMNTLKVQQAAYLFANRGRQACVTVEIDATKFDIHYRIDSYGKLCVDIRGLSTALCHDSLKTYAYFDIFYNFRNHLTALNKDKCFTGDSCDRRNPNLGDLLTCFGFRYMLSFYANTSRQLAVKAIHSAFVDAGLLPAFEKLPRVRSAEVETFEALIPEIQRRYPTLNFKRGVNVRVRNGNKRRRIMDSYCDSILLNLECNERTHLNRSDYDENYTRHREADIRGEKGAEVEFYYCKPHDYDFSVNATVDDICQRIAKIIERDGLQTPCFVNDAPPSEDIVFYALDLSHDTAPPSLKQLMELRRQISEQLTKVTGLRREYLKSMADLQVRALTLSVLGNPCNIYYCIDKSRDDLVVFNRISVCEAIGWGRRSHNEAFASWRAGLPKSELRKCFAKPVGSNIRRQGKPKLHTESLSPYGCQAMLNYFEQSQLSENIKCVRDALVRQCLLPAYDTDSKVGIANRGQLITVVLSHLQKRFHDHVFEKNKRVRVAKGGCLSSRRLGIWCDGLKLNVELHCVGNSYHVKGQTDSREADIRSTTGQETEFFYLFPHDEDFDFGEKMAGLSAFVAVLTIASMRRLKKTASA